mmetsp:Transcript_155058/g.476296  ORF Transcript_155058/g.476296 Transcript_155058/m.476296 type:complete len:310 (+) Transcript_155058:75-1004(+)
MARPLRTASAEGSHLQQRCRLRPAVPLLLLLAAAAASLRAAGLPRLLASRPAQLLAPAGSDAGAAAAEPSAPIRDGGLAGFLGAVQGALQPLEEQVNAGGLVPQFGQRADALLADFAARAGDAGPQLARAVDGMLQTLFLRQLALLRQQIASKFEKAPRPLEAVEQADERFVTLAEELKRPGSDWSYEDERYALRALLEGALKRDEALVEERLAAQQTQQSTAEVISKLQSQMEALQQKVQAMRAGSPWFLSASYRIPKTPFQLIGRYQQGRTNLELSLNQDRDPANAEAGFVQGWGPMNLGVGLNLGF